MSKYKKSYSFRHFWKTQEKEKEELTPKSGKMKQVVITRYGTINEQIITYKTRKYSQVVYRDNKGRFIKNPSKKIQKEVKPSEREKGFTGFFGKTEYWKQAIFAEIPYHRRYYWFGIVEIEKKENLTPMSDLKIELIELLEKNLGYKLDEFNWFDAYPKYAYEYAKPTYQTNKGKHYEKWSLTKP